MIGLVVQPNRTQEAPVEMSGANLLAGKEEATQYGLERPNVRA